MKSKIFILLIALFSVVISCEKETHENPYKGLLKRKSFYRSNQDSTPVSISDYEYDSKLRLKTIQDNSHREIFEYNENNELIRKSGYKIDNNGSTLSDTTHYEYQKGDLVFEETCYLTNGNIDTYQFQYEYENSKLIRKQEYHNHDFWRMTEYEYLNDLCIKEMNFSDSIGTWLNYYKKHMYDNQKLSMSAMITIQGVGYPGTTLQVIYYFYDDSGKLVFENAEQREDVGGLEYCYRYEYY